MPGQCQCAKVSATSLSKSGVKGEVSCMLNGIWKAADKAEQQEMKLLKRSNIVIVGVSVTAIDQCRIGQESSRERSSTECK